MLKVMTLWSTTGSPNPTEAAAELKASPAGRSLIALSANPAASLGPGRPAPPGGSIIGYFEASADAEQWKHAVDGYSEAGTTTICVEHVVRGADKLYRRGRRRPLDGLKLVAFLQPIGNMTHAEFGDYWLGSHAALARRTIPDGIWGPAYVQNHAVDESQPHAAVAESYWADIAELRAWSEWYEGEPGTPLRDDEANFLDTNRRTVLITVEGLVDIDPPG